MPQPILSPRKHFCFCFAGCPRSMNILQLVISQLYNKETCLTNKTNWNKLTFRQAMCWHACGHPSSVHSIPVDCTVLSAPRASACAGRKHLQCTWCIILWRFLTTDDVTCCSDTWPDWSSASDPEASHCCQVRIPARRCLAESSWTSS